MAFIKEHLGQARPANTTAVSIVTPINDQIVIIQQIIVCNTTGSAATFRIFLDNDGTTYSEATALIYDYSLDANDMIEFSFGQDSISGLYMTNIAGNLAIRSGTASALTYTINGTIMVSG